MNKKTSWKTTAGAWVGGGIMIVLEIADALGIAIAQSDGVFEWDKITMALGIVGIGWFARDNDVSSEDAGAK